MPIHRIPMWSWNSDIICLSTKFIDLVMSFKYKLFPEKTKETKYNKVFTLYEDRSGIIWIGTAGSGLMKFNKGKNQFQILKSDPYNFSNYLSHSEVYSIIYDPKGFTWFCTRRALDKYDLKTGTYKHYLQNEECITQSLYYAVQEKSGYIWLGTSSCGLIRFDPSDGSYSFYLNDITKSANLVDKHIMSLFQDHIGIHSPPSCSSWRAEHPRPRPRSAPTSMGRKSKARRGCMTPSSTMKTTWITDKIPCCGCYGMETRIYCCGSF